MRVHLNAKTMEYEQIKKLMEDMGNSKLADVSIEFPNGIKISMKKDYKNATELVPKEFIKEENLAKQSEFSFRENEPTKKEDGKIIKSPMVGKFYSKPSPDSKPFVKVGQNVKKGDVLCIIEAMKLLNEIESEFDGEIKEILINEGEMVDFGKPLFKVG